LVQASCKCIPLGGYSEAVSPNLCVPALAATCECVWSAVGARVFSTIGPSRVTFTAA
jgi:hypothetical protein